MPSKIGPLISIIVPVYNVESYLTRCVESLLTQTHSNLEIFLVNDGSTDRSGVICDELAIKDWRINVIHQENAGVSTARNAGLDAARGKWIGFVDSDDWVEPDMYEKLLREAIKNKKNIVVCGNVIHGIDGKLQKNEIYTKLKKPITQMEALGYIIRQQYLRGSVCNMMFSRNILETESPVRFDTDIHGGEDRLFSVRAFLRANGSSYVPEALYHVCQRKGSATTLFNPRRITVLLGYERTLELVSPVCDNLARRTRFNYMDVSVYLINRAVRSGQREHLPMLRKAARRYARKYFFARDISIPKKLRNAAVTYFPRLTNRLWAMLQGRFKLKRLISKLNKR